MGSVDMNLPNIITIMRICLVPIFLIVFWSENPNSLLYAMTILALAGISDIIDGYLARKLNLVTSLGKVLDPAADKLMVITALTSLFLKDLVPLWLVALIVLKELILILGSGFIVLKREQDVSANIFGKIATVSMYAALFSASFELPEKNLFLLSAGFFAILSLVNYLINYFNITSGGTKC